MLNRVILIGRLGKDVEKRVTTNNTSVANLKLATTIKQKHSSGNFQEITTWHNVICWGSLADYSCENLRKGTMVLVEGTIEGTKYKSKEGIDVNTYQIKAENIKKM